MKKIYGIVIIIIAASVMMLSIDTASAKKVSICHVPPGNPDNFHTIRISEEAVEAHLAEHPLDYEGECDEPDVSNAVDGVRGDLDRTARRPRGLV